MDSRNRLRLAGALLLAGAAEVIPAISLAESRYPGYNVSLQPLSDLGATCVTVSGARTCFSPPSSTIFDAAVIGLGLLAFVAAILIMRTGFSLFGATLLLGGFGAMGVGVFSETWGAVHILMSLITFLFAGVSALLAYRLCRAPMRYFCLALGGVSLVALALYSGDVYLGIGQGGMERMIAYPALVWVAAFGSYLMGDGLGQSPAQGDINRS